MAIDLEKITIEELNEYEVAAKYLIKKALLTGDGKMLQATKTLMNTASIQEEPNGR